MQFPADQRLATLAALALLMAGPEVSQATPLTGDAAGRAWAEPRPTRSLSDAEIVGAGIARPETGMLDPSTPVSAVQQYLQGTAGDVGSPWGRDNAASYQYGTNTGSPYEVFRSLVNVPKGGLQNVARRPGGAPESDVLGADAREWIDDTVRGIVNSAIELRVNEQGRTTFSVLGMGDFGVMMSGDRNQVALVSGDDPLLTLQRVPLGQSGLGPGSSAVNANAPGNATAGPAGTARAYSLQQAIETLEEIALHPLSVLIYAIVGGFAVLWKLMNSQTQRQPASPAAFRTDSTNTTSHRGSGRRRSRRSRRV